jgi:transcriptional regulator with XRE-family HTH domain
MTQEELADATGLHLRTVQKIEAGEINILVTTVQKLQRALECPWEKLTGRNLLFAGGVIGGTGNGERGGLMNDW